MSARDGGPLRHFGPGVVWAHGAAAPWAVFEVDRAGCLFAGRSERRESRQFVEHVCRNVDHALILGVASPVPADSLAAAQRVEGASAAYDQWSAAAAGGEWWERSYWVSVRLGSTESLVSSTRRWASDRWKQRAGVAAAAPSADEEKRALTEAVSVRSRLGGVRLASTAEVEWLAARRYEPALPRPPGDEPDGGPGRRWVSPWADTVVDPDPARRLVWLRRPRGAASACASLVVTGSPNVAFDVDPDESMDAGLVCRAECAAPGPWPLDWSVRVWRDARDEKLLRWRARNVAHQVKSGNESDAAGADPSKEQASDELTDLGDRLAEKAGPELRVVTTFTVWAGDEDTLDARLDAVAGAVGGGWELSRPPADQDRLLNCQVPGVSLPLGVADWADHLLPAGVASFGLFAGGEHVGDPDGLLMGRVTGSTLGEPFVWDPTRGPTRGVNTDGNLLITGKPGRGKSNLGKTLGLATAAAGGMVLVIDPSPNGEWAKLARAAAALGWSAEVAHPDEGSVSLDPLRVLPPGQAVDAAVACLASLAGCDAGSAESAAIRERVEEVHRSSGSLIQVVDGLANNVKDPVALTVGRRLAGLSKHRHAAALFNRQAPPVSSTAGLVVVAMNDLSLPEETGKRALTEAQIVGQAVVSAAIGYARAWAFGRPEFTLVVFEEFGVLQVSPWIVDQVGAFMKLSRKYNAAGVGIMQFGAEVRPQIASGCSQVAAFACPDNEAETAAVAALLGRAGDEQVMAVLPDLPNGRMLFKMTDGRVGPVQVMLPPITELAAAADTSVDRPRRAVAAAA